MIIQNFLEFTKYLPAIEIKVDIASLNDIFLTANEDLASEILGDELYTLVDKRLEDDKPLLKRCERVIALSSFLKSIPDLDLILTQAGFVVRGNSDVVPASRQRVDALISSVQTRLDNATDSLIKYLLASRQYDDEWRGSDQFDRISSGLISTFDEFKRYAPYSPAVAERYPKSYSDFSKYYPNLSVALMTEVSSYLSEEYCSELLEKYKDREVFSAYDMKVLELVRYALCAIVLGDTKSGREHVISAVSYMRKNIIHYPTFSASSASQSTDLSHSDTPIFSMF